MGSPEVSTAAEEPRHLFYVFAAAQREDGAALARSTCGRRTRSCGGWSQDGEEGDRVAAGAGGTVTRDDRRVLEANGGEIG